MEFLHELWELSVRDDSPERILQHCTLAQAADLGDGQAPEGAGHKGKRQGQGYRCGGALGLRLSARPCAQREGVS